MKPQLNPSRILLFISMMLFVFFACNKIEPEIDDPINGGNKPPKDTVNKDTIPVVPVNAVYIDPGYTGVEKGTKAEPYNSWTDIKWNDGGTYLLKKGTTMTVDYKLRPSASNVTIGAYGTGNRPLIKSSVDKIFDLGALNNIVIRDLEVESTNNAITCFHFFNSVRGAIINCKIHGAQWGVRNVRNKPELSTGLFRIIDCEIYDTQDDGSFNSDIDSIELAGTYIHDTNKKYFVNPSETYSGGDCFQMVNVKYFNIHDNKLDHGNAGNKFCIIANSSIPGFVATGIIEHNELYRNNEGNLVYLAFADNVIVRRNTFRNAGIAIYNHSSNLKVYFNEFINITGLLYVGGGPKGTDTKYINNTFYNVNKILESFNENIAFQNNIVFNCTGKMFIGAPTNIKRDYNCYYKTPAEGDLGTHSIQVDPLFTDASRSDFSLKANSPCINKGNNIAGTFLDIHSRAVPRGSAVDIGSHEF